MSTENSVGGWSNGKQTTWWNIDLINLLGNDIYEKNEMFVLRLNQISNSSVNFPQTASTDNLLEINISGLNFCNSTYDVRTGNNGHRNKMLLVNIPTSAAQSLSFPPNVSYHLVFAILKIIT